jgi:hypothetical protein
MICTEAFSCLLLAAETTGKLSGIKVCQNAPSINHLLFADDSLLLLKANEWSANHLQNILSLYEDCSGQTINKDKSSVMFSKNTKNAEKSQVMLVLNISTEAYNEKYLGLPIYMGKSKKQTFARGKGVEKNSGVERKAFIKGQQRCPYQGSSTSYPDLCNAMLYKRSM